MSDLLIEQFCQMLAEHLEDDSSVSKSESIAFLRSVIQADARLRTVFEDRMVQFNQGNAVGFQTWLESGARGFFGTNYVVQDPAVLRDGMTTLLDELARRPVGIPSNLPLSGVVKFVGREEQLAQVHEKLQAASTVAVTSVSGMGGVGKTELALQYAYQHLQSQTYPGGLCWINVRSQDVGLGLLEFARTQLGLPEPPDMLETLLEKVQWVCRRWQGEPILVVLDDVTDDQVVRPYLDLLDPRFRVLMTTRLKLLASAQRLELEVLTEAASLELLRVLVDDPYRIDSQLADAQRLCEWLGYLPLGLELVGRYLTEDEDVSVGEMLELLLQERLTAEALLEAYPEMTASLGVATAFELSWKELTDEAKKLSCLLSIFALAPMPWNLIEQCLPDWEKKQLKLCRDRQLKKRSLLSRVGQELYQLHQLLREFFAVKREQMVNDVALKQKVCRVMASVAQKMPAIKNLAQVEQFTSVVPHLKEVATTFHSWLSDADLVFPSTHVAQFYEAQAAYDVALHWYQHCQETAEARLGENDPDVAWSLNNLANLYQLAGRYAEAEAFHQRSLAIREQQLGTNHLDVAQSLNNLANLYQQVSRYTEAELLYARSLSIAEQQLGENHLDVALSLSNLAELYRLQGRYEEAESILVRSLSIREQQEENHPDIAISLNGLAGVYLNQGRYGEAESLYIRSISIQEQQLGESHPHLARILSNLAALYQAQGRYTEAESLFVRSLSILEQQFDQTHPNIALTLNNLAELYRLQGRYGEAEPLFVRSLSIREQNFGKEHPDVAGSLNGLGGLYLNQGRYGEAESFFVRSLAIQEKHLGEKHPDVALHLMNLAELYRLQGRYGEAEPLYVRSLSIQEQQLGENHPHVALIIMNFANLYQAQRLYSKAEPLYARSLSILEQQLDENHPHIAISLNNLAEVYRSQGRYEEAEPLYQRSLALWEKQLGFDHPDIATSLNNLALLYQAEGRYSEAESLYKRSLTVLEKQLGSDHPNIANSLNNLAGLYVEAKYYRDAEILYLRAIEILDKNKLGEDHPTTQTCRRNFLHFLQKIMEAGETARLSDHPLTKITLQKLKITSQGHSAHTLKSRDATGRLAYYVILVSPSVEQEFLQALNSTASIDLENYGEIIASCYGESPDEATKAFLKEQYGLEI